MREYQLESNNLYANGVSVFAEAALFRTRAHAVGVAAKQIVHH